MYFFQNFFFIRGSICPDLTMQADFCNLAPCVPVTISQNVFVIKIYIAEDIQEIAWCSAGRKSYLYWRSLKDLTAGEHPAQDLKPLRNTEVLAAGIRVARSVAVWLWAGMANVLCPTPSLVTWQRVGLTDNIYSQLHDSWRHLQLDENI